MKKKICFVLLSAPWNVLCFYAEEISLRVPLQLASAPMVDWSQEMLSRLSVPSPLSQDVPGPPPYYYTCQFRTSKLQRSWPGPGSSMFDPGPAGLLNLLCLQVPGERRPRRILQDHPETPGGEFRGVSVVSSGARLLQDHPETPGGEFRDTVYSRPPRDTRW